MTVYLIRLHTAISEIGDNGKQLNGADTMLNLERILKQDRLIRAMTGLNRKAFESLLPSFTEAYECSLLKDLGSDTELN